MQSKFYQIRFSLLLHKKVEIYHLSFIKSRYWYSHLEGYLDNSKERKHLLSVMSKPPSISKFKGGLHPITFPFKND